jgi:PST family polysaccharide transporter
VALALAGILRIATELAYDCLAAVGRTVPILVIHAAWLVVLTPALAIGADRSGIVGVAAAQLGVLTLVVAPAYVYALARSGIPLRSYRHGVGRLVVGAGALVIVAMVAAVLADRATTALLIGGPLAVCAYAGVVAPAFVPSVMRSRSALRRRPLGVR